jgi:hypothetical protein
MAYSIRQREHIYKWRESNREKYNEYSRQKNREQYLNFKDKIKCNRMARYYYQKEAELFRLILL